MKPAVRFQSQLLFRKSYRLIRVRRIRSTTKVNPVAHIVRADAVGIVTRKDFVT
jgi:hypothetical protein